MQYEKVQAALIDNESLPWIPFLPYSDGVFVKYFKLDPIRGEMIALMRVPARVLLPQHYQSGTVISYTIEGRWKFREYEWIAGPGSVVFEPAASRHTPETGITEGEVLLLDVVVGELLFQDEDGKILAIENWKTAMERYLAHCRWHGIAPRDLTAFS
ncbi:2,4'-dihydroxyacetophenone dioxygenase family protein [Ramlibacter sp. WS9]|uniref:2,4'-dihydroxyacetophenone dioxygenase family protein n=1 Tax=Ramlibacter sp. WS9 TaxID=1882741 RepID=UPI00114412F0|nr:2,4'-dihydroxyacetophenone dioxygenase family protein [Ramlibacter sp. WS9]ROZ75799.1 cupin [Ramlibacter sp. WS9]